MWLVPLAQMLPCPQSIFPFQNLVFWNLFEFSLAEITLKINISHILNPNLIKINSIKSCSSRSFQQHQKHNPMNSFEILSYDLISFSVKILFNIQELLHYKSKHHETLSSSRAFQRHQEHNLKH
jgi:hypothetical protein